jgi:hypothetical protein
VGGATAGGQLAAGASGDLPYGNWSNNNNEYKDKDLLYNAYPHQREGQNVLYNDGHTKFETTANAGVDGDNIYQRWAGGTPGWQAPPATSTPPQKPEREAGGLFPTYSGSSIPVANYNALVPGDTEDALLISEVRP